jgi:hypothetical protein
MFWAAFFLKPDAAVAEGFTETCRNIRGIFITGSYYIYGECLRRDGMGPAPYRDTLINLSELLKSNPAFGGALEWTTPVTRNVLPAFTDNCDPYSINFYFDGPALRITIQCGAYLFAEYPNAFISNIDGVLTYDLIPGLGTPP